MTSADSFNPGNVAAQIMAEGDNPLRPASPPSPSAEAASPSAFREPTLVGSILGRYSPSAMLSSAWNPQTRESAAWQRKVGGLLDDMIGMPAMIAGPLWAKEGYQGLRNMQAAERAAEAAKGPWGNPHLLDEMLAQRPRVPRHEINEAPPPAARDRPYDAVEQDYQKAVSDALGLLETQASGRGVATSPDHYQAWRELSSYEKMRNPDRGGASTLGADLRRHADNNEHLPGVRDEAERLADHLAALEKERAISHGRDWSMRDAAQVADAQYFDDAYRFNQPRLDRFGEGQSHVMERGDLKRILVDEFGADPQSAESMKNAYAAFWQEENARRAAGKMTRHEEDARRLAWQSDMTLRDELGVDPDSLPTPELRRMWRDNMSKHYVEIEDLLDALRKQQTDRGVKVSDFADKLLKYGPPTAVGAYVGDKLGKALRERGDEFARTPEFARMLVNLQAPKMSYAPQLPAFASGGGVFAAPHKKGA